MVVNEELVKKLGLTHPQEALNKELNFWDGETRVTIVGVVKNFHTQSLQEPISPVVIGNYKRTYQLSNIKLNVRQAGATIAFIEKLWNRVYPEFVFEYRFLDQTIANFYRQQKQLSDLYKIFAAIAIFLSCLGLYGLASFMAVQRVKEVGIRKVLGASVQHIVYLFSKEFIVLITIAFVISAPIAWYFMHRWLQDFAYRTDLSWWIFLVAGCLALLIALITISFQSIKAAMANPVKNLRTE
ncbi:MAG: FtsX-like permease family protein [Flavisolibacter sp.]|nr:FtsX-like permease family protein [Flavisolibacter sp.]